MHLSAPESIIINTGYQSSRFSVGADEALFLEITEACGEILATAFSEQDAPVPVSQEEWFGALMSKSIYLEYPADCQTSLFARLLGVKNPPAAEYVQSFLRLVVSADAPAVVYLEDSNTTSYYRISTSHTPEALLELIADYQAGSEASSTSSSILNYSFDLRFDQSVSGQNAIIAPMVPIYSNPQTARSLQAENPMKTAAGSLDWGVIERILNVFDMNPDTVRHYTETGGTIVFVQNDAVLKLYTDGLLDYRAKGGGMRLTRDPGAHRVLSEIAALADAVTDAANAQANLYVSSPLYESSNHFTLDYSAGGLPVILETPAAKHAVEVQVEDGYLLSYRQLLRRYHIGAPQQTPAYISALDDAIAEYSASMNEIVIEKIYLSYTDDASDAVKNADWTVAVKSLVERRE